MFNSKKKNKNSFKLKTKIFQKIINQHLKANNRKVKA